MDQKELIRVVDRDEFSALIGAVKEIAAAVKRMEDRLDHIEGRLSRMEDRMTAMEDRMTSMEERQERMETDLKAFRKENRDQLTRISRRLDRP